MFLREQEASPGSRLITEILLLSAGKWQAISKRFFCVASFYSLLFNLSVISFCKIFQVYVPNISTILFLQSSAAISKPM
jgi:hypothetical protein